MGCGYLAPGRSETVPSKESRAAILGLIGREKYLVYGHRFGETLESVRALGVEAKELPDTELTHGCRNSDATGRCNSAKSCRQLDRGPEQVAFFCDRFTDADANAEVDGPFSIFVSVAQRSLNFDAGLDSSGRGRERRHDPVTGVLHLAAPLLVQSGTHDLVVLSNEHHEPVVTELLSLLCRVTKVSEQNGPNS